MCRFVAVLGLAAGVAIAGGLGPLGPGVPAGSDAGGRRPGVSDDHVYHAHTHWHDGHAHTHWHSHHGHDADSQSDTDGEHHHAFGEHGSDELPVLPPIARYLQGKNPTSKIRLHAHSAADINGLEPPPLPPPKPPPKPSGHQGDLPQLRTVILLT